MAIMPDTIPKGWEIMPLPLPDDIDEWMEDEKFLLRNEVTGELRMFYPGVGFGPVVPTQDER